MKVLVPISLNFGDLTLSSIPETDAPEWVSSNTYSIGERVVRIHRVYERVIAGASSAVPESDVANWLDIGPTNRWAPFDANPGTACVMPPSTPARWVFDVPSSVKSIVLLGVQGARIEIRVNSQLVRDIDIDPARVISAIVISGISAPVSSSLDLRILGSVSDGSVLNTRLGWCGLGDMKDLGETMPGASLSLLDYSIKNTSDFGIVSVIRRPYARRLQAQAVMPTSDVDVLTNVLSALRAAVTWWQVDDSLSPLECYSALGFVRDWSVDVPGPVKTSYSVTIEGIAQEDVEINPGQPITLSGAEALVDSSNYDVRIESSLGTQFRYGQKSQTLLTARVFRNGEEVTDDVPDSWFKWKRKSLYPQPAPNDDDSWNVAYRSGYKSISVSVDDVMCKAVFTCYLIKP